jgi:hypothetical protein
MYELWAPLDARALILLVVVSRIELTIRRARNGSKVVGVLGVTLSTVLLVFDPLCHHVSLSHPALQRSVTQQYLSGALATQEQA